jgi:hypothetical protein
MVFDEEGRRLPNQSVNWNVDLGTIISSDSVTNCVGEACCVVRSTTNHETATITAQTGSQISYGWVEYGIAGDPSVLPITPENGTVLSDGVDIQYYLYDPDCEEYNIYSIEIFIDGQSIGYVTETDPIYYWETFTCANGAHTIRAKATDSDGNIMWSPTTTVQTDNYINNISATPDEFDPSLGEQATISATLNESVDWTLTIQDTEGTTTVYTTMGNGNSVSCSWDGATALNEDLFQYTIETTSGSHIGATAKGWVAKKIIPDNQVEVLSVAARGLKYWPLAVCRLYDYAKTRGFKAKKLYPKTGTWARISSILAYHNCRMLYIDSHGYYGPAGKTATGTYLYRTVMELTDGLVLSYPAAGGPPLAVSTLNLENSNQMRFVFLDSCLSGKCGSVSGENDMAKAFGMYSSSNMSAGDQTYIGWYAASGDNLTYADWVWELFYKWYPAGRTLERAEWLAYYTDTSKFNYIYNTNLKNYGGSNNTSYFTTFFEVH